MTEFSTVRNGFLISAAHKSAGKTTVSVGLAAVLARRGLGIATFKKGPDYIDPMWLSRAANRTCLNLDFFTQSHDEVRRSFGNALAGCHVALVEGNKGLHDGLDLEGSDSNAALAKLLGLPVILVLDGQGMTRGIAPLLMGYRLFDPEIRIAGVVLNKVAGPRHESKLRAAVERYTDIPVIGAIGRSAKIRIKERHLGLIPSNEHQAADERVATIAKLVEESIDVEALLRLTGYEPSVTEPAPETPTAAGAHRIKVGIARDAAFGFYYPDDLVAFERSGADLVPFDTLNDPYLPDLDALFIGGGFPESFVDALESNVTLREDIRHFIESGRPVYAECGGLMYLCRSLTSGDQTGDMVGAIPADAVMTDRPVGRGYLKYTESNAHPWAAQQPEGHEYHAHEFHYSRLENFDHAGPFACRVTRGVGIDGTNDGFVYKGLLACYAHQRQVSGNPWVSRFVDHVRKHTATAKEM